MSDDNTASLVRRKGPDPEVARYFRSLSPSSEEEFALSADKNDPLKKYRFEFEMPRGLGRSASYQSIYLNGNSLGPLPKRAKWYVAEEMDKWGRMGVEGHWDGTRPWFSIDDRCNELMTRVVGAKDKSEVAVMNGLTTNCHLLLVSFFRPNQERFKILIEGQAFCSDHHLVRSHLRWHGLREQDALIEVMPPSEQDDSDEQPKEEFVRTERILECISKNRDSLAMIWLGAVQYYSGQLFEIKKITEYAKTVSDGRIMVGFDCAHAVGNVPLELHDWGVDCASWCSYKYLNSHPGGLAGVFIHQRHHHRQPGLSCSSDSLVSGPIQRLDGWWGQDDSVKINMHQSTHIPMKGAGAWRLSNPPVLPTVCLQASLEVITDAGIYNLREKSLVLTGYLEMLVNARLPKWVRSISPNDPSQRGCQLSLVFEGVDIERVHRQLQNEGVICDLRKPKVMRIAPNPLYNSFLDVWRFVDILERSLIENQHQSDGLIRSVL